MWRLGPAPRYVGRIEGADGALTSAGEDVDAVDIDRFGALYGQACLDPVIGDGVFQCGTPPDDVALDLIAPPEHEDDPWLADLRFGPQGSWGWDRLRPGSYAFDSAAGTPGGAGGLLPSLTFSLTFRDPCLERVPGLKLGGSALPASPRVPGVERAARSEELLLLSRQPPRPSYPRAGYASSTCAASDRLLQLLHHDNDVVRRRARSRPGDTAPPACSPRARAAGRAA